ncbi:GL10401 [Drosophila persimilis]|uniref:GL10401 n=1 Tax=Drosophila persimilis TaxID=7234 RepID=B4GCV4_DROPE|nr:GL10401 [Drosophila persimilis]
MKDTKAARAISESSTTSDNTSDFIDIVKRYDVVYNNHNPDYKNVEVKLKVWTQIADEIGLSVEASKRKWKNLRDSYTKYLRSFRVGTKTSKKYQYWAHADHMEFLKPFQGPGSLFLAYRQYLELDFAEPYLTAADTEGRAHFDVNGFAKKYALGSPIAANFFVAKWEWAWNWTAD